MSTNEFRQSNQDEFFSQWTYRSMFDPGSTVEEQEDWLRRVQDFCREKDMTFIVRAIEQDGQRGLEFGFDSQESEALFWHHINGDPLIDKGADYIFPFNFNDPDYRELFIEAAEMHLNRLHIPYRIRIENDDVRFTVYRYSHRTALQMLVKDGALDVSARILSIIRKYQETVPTRPFDAAPLDNEPTP